MVILLSKSNTNVDRFLKLHITNVSKRQKMSWPKMVRAQIMKNKLCEKIATFDSCFFRLKKNPINPSQCKTTWLNRKVR